MTLINEYYVADAWKELPRLAESLTYQYDFIIADPLYDLDLAQKEQLDFWFEGISKNGYVAFSSPENPFIENVDDIIHHMFWIKPLSTKNYKAMKNPSRFVELMQYRQVFPEHRVWNGAKQHWSMSTNVYSDIVQEPMLHDQGWRKPLSLIKRLIKLYTNPGDTILDPFAGSGVVAEACMELGRGFVCFDNNADYVYSAKQRLNLYLGE